MGGLLGVGDERPERDVEHRVELTEEALVPGGVGRELVEASVGVGDLAIAAKALAPMGEPSRAEGDAHHPAVRAPVGALRLGLGAVDRRRRAAVVAVPRDGPREAEGVPRRRRRQF